MSRRSVGEYVPLSVSAMDDDAMLVCDPGAELLFYRAMQVAGQLPTDGYLTEAQIVHRAGARLGTPAKVKALLRQLVQAGPVVEVDGGYQLRAWLKWNKSAQELGRKRANDRERKRAERSGQPPDDGGSPPSVRADTDGTPDGHHTESGGSPNGTQPESERSPASRASTYAGHGTALHDTTTTEASLPPGDSEIRPDVDRICDHLADRIAANGSRRPAVGKKWRTAARLILDLDGRTEAQVHAAIDWCQDDEFWRGNILSMPTLRERYDQLRLQAQRDNGAPRAPAGDPYLNDIRAGVYGPADTQPLRIVPALEV
jgi:hypothetical protein